MTERMYYSRLRLAPALGLRVTLKTDDDGALLTFMADSPARLLSGLRLLAIETEHLAADVREHDWAAEIEA